MFLNFYCYTLKKIPLFSPDRRLVLSLPNAGDVRKDKRVNNNCQIFVVIMYDAAVHKKGRCGCMEKITVNMFVQR